MLYEHKDEAIIDPRDDDLLKLRYDYLASKIDEATALIERQLEMLRSNDLLISEINEAFEIVRSKTEAAKNGEGSDG